MFSKLYNALIKAEITDLEYEKELNRIAQIYPDVIQKHFGRRKDTRTLGQFGLGIAKEKLAEFKNVANWCEKFSEKHFGLKTSVEPYGIEHSGCLVMQDGKKSDFKKPDFKLVPPGGLLEYKKNPCINKFTYKVADLKSYANEDCWVLTICYSDDVPQIYILMEPSDVQRIVSHIDNTILVTEKRFEMGYKECIQFYNPNVPRSNNLSENSVDITAYTKIHTY